MASRPLAPITPEQPQRSGAARVLVIDRRPLEVAAMSKLLSGPPLYAEVLGTTRSDEALALLAGQVIDLLVCAVEAEPVAGPDLAVIVATQHPSVKVVLVGNRTSATRLRASVRSGAAGFFMKESGVQEFTDGVCAILHGQFVVGWSLQGRV